ncbi:MAG: hypothetical protein ABSG78_23905 [Verrucomicrobiota bacterium]
MKSKNALCGLSMAVFLQLGVLAGSAQTNIYLFSGSETNITLNPGTYIITAYGAPGGGGYYGGFGAEMSGEFTFSTSTYLTLLVGEGGGIGGVGAFGASGGNGGGGGSFVVGSTPLVIAGGGGGGGSYNGGYPNEYYSSGGAGSTGQFGGDLLSYSGHPGGSGGYPGDGGGGGGPFGGGGGGGYDGGGVGGYDGYYGGGGGLGYGNAYSFVNGGYGGYGGVGAFGASGGHGGYGGGGGGGIRFVPPQVSEGGGGGGGGYSGGGGGYGDLDFPAGVGGGGGGGSIIDSSAIAILAEVSGIASPDDPANGEIIITAVPTPLVITTHAAFGFTNGVYVTGPSGSNVVIQASTDLQTWIPLQTNLLGSGPLHFSDAQSPANVRRFYRAQISP